MKKEEIIEALCKLCSTVGTEVFDNKYAHDCFCHKNTCPFEFNFDKLILDYIKEAVQEKMTREREKMQIHTQPWEDFADWVICTNCNTEMAVSPGTMTCPVCEKEGTLIWKDPLREEIYISGKPWAGAQNA